MLQVTMSVTCHSGSTPLLMTTIPAVETNRPLPPNPFDKDLHSLFHAAYDQCLKHQEAAQLSKQEATTTSKEEEYAKEVVYGRCLGYLLTETPHTDAKHIAADEIIGCDGCRENMNQPAETCINHIIRLCQRFAFTQLIPINVSDSPTEQGG